MPTFKQLEALFWIAKLGSFERAARHLHASQSAISKRIQELEAMSASPLFDRARRSACLTAHGEALVAIAADAQVLTARAAALMQPGAPANLRVRLGVTEMTAMTWLPDLVAEIRKASPGIDLEAEVESSLTLVKRLRQREIDLIIVPDAFPDLTLGIEPVGQVDNAWMCSPALSLPRRTLPLAEIANWTLLMQDGRSGSGLIYLRWLERNHVSIGRSLTSNSVMALLGLTVSGLGVSHLPIGLADPMLQSGALRLVRTKPALPAVPYVAMYVRGQLAPHVRFVVDLSRQCCNFSPAKSLTKKLPVAARVTRG